MYSCINTNEAIITLPNVGTIMEYCIDDFNNGMSLTAISKKRKHCRNRIAKFLSDRGVRRSISRIEHNKQQSRLKNHDLFTTINTPEKSYWLGFILADGSIQGEYNTRLKIALNKKDVNHLYNFCAFMGLDKNLYYYAKTNSYAVSVGSKKLCSDLATHGVIPRKSLIEYDLFIPIGFEEEFFAGYLDGDGSVKLLPANSKSRYKSLKLEINICGSKQICEEYKKLFKRGSVSLRKDIVYTYQTSCVNREFSETIYPESIRCIALQRKLNMTLCFWPLREKFRKWIGELTEEAKLLIREIKYANSVPKALEIVKNLESGVTHRR